MTNPATLRRTVPAIGNGVATSFPFTFKVFAASDVAVVRTVLETGVETVLTLGSDYLVSLNSDQDATPGGSVTYPVSGALLDSDHSLTVYGDTDYTQDLDLAGGGKFNPTNIENALDRLSFQIQQLLEQMSRSLTAAVSTPSGADFTLPAPVADSLLGWDATGLKFKNFPFSSIASNVTGNLNVMGNLNAAGAITLGVRPGVGDNSSLVPDTSWVRTLFAGALPKSGGTMTGKIVLDGDATLALHPVPKQQMDAAIPSIASSATTQAGVSTTQTVSPKGLADSVLAGKTQTWQTVTGSRAFSVAYTNSTGAPIIVMAYVTGVGAGGPTAIGYVDGELRFHDARDAAGPGVATTVILFVQPGSTYSVTGLNYTLTRWSELRA